MQGTKEQQDKALNNLIKVLQEPEILEILKRLKDR